MTLDRMQTLRAAIMEARDQIRNAPRAVESYEEAVQVIFYLNALTMDAMDMARTVEQFRDELKDDEIVRLEKEAREFYAGKDFEREQARVARSEPWER